MRLKDEKFYKTVRDFLDIYLIRHRGYSLNTQKSYREAINLLLLYFKAERGLEYSNVGFEDITYSNITGFLEWLSKSRGCSPATSQVLRHNFEIRMPYLPGCLRCE